LLCLPSGWASWPTWSRIDVRGRLFGAASHFRYRPLRGPHCSKRDLPPGVTPGRTDPPPQIAPRATDVARLARRCSRTTCRAASIPMAAAGRPSPSRPLRVIRIEAWRNRPIEGEHPYVYLDGIVLKPAGPARCATCRCWWRFDADLAIPYGCKLTTQQTWRGTMLWTSAGRRRQCRPAHQA
jgi:hypothetical protein